jgi:hypothetical protein
VCAVFVYDLCCNCLFGCVLIMYKISNLCNVKLCCVSIFALLSAGI